MELSDLLVFFDDAKAAETWARQGQGQLIWFSSDNKRTYEKKPLLHIGDLRAVGFADVGFRQWSAGVSISDDGLAASRRTAATQIVIDCRSSLKPLPGTLERREIVQWLINRDRPPLAAALRQEAERVLIAERDRHQGSFAEALDHASNQAKLEDALKAQFKKLGFEVRQVGALLADRTEIESYDFQDEAVGISVRLAGGLNATRVNWLARIKSSETGAGRAARSAYRGGFRGTVAKPYAGGVPGQHEPVEAWLAMLIGDALSGVSMKAFIGEEELDWRDGLRAAVSERLERGTGFVVSELEVKPTVAPPQWKPAVFRLLYEITGTPGRAMAIEHRMQYRMIDEAAWKAAGSPDPESQIALLTHEIILRFLQSMMFGDVVARLHGEAGAKDLGEKLGADLGPVARQFGHEVSVIVCILHIPWAEYLTGRTLEIAEQDYHLKDAGQTVKLGAEIEVRVNPGQLAKFASAQTSLVQVQVQELSADDDDKLRLRIEGLVQQALRKALQSTNASAYYRSEFTSGDPASVGSDGNRIDVANVENDLREHAQSELAELGLDVVRLRLRVSDDPIIRRMHDLRMRPVPIDMEVTFEGRTSQLAGDALVRDFSREHWQAFYHNARRYPEVDEHLKHIERYLQSAIGKLKSEFSEGEDATREMIRRGDLQGCVAEALETSVGIIVDIAFLHLEVPSDFDPAFSMRRISQMEGKILELESQPGGFEDDERAQQVKDLEDRIGKIRGAIRTGRKEMKSIALITHQPSEAAAKPAAANSARPQTS